MKIKKHGKKYEDKPKLEEFECEKCGCEFNAKDDEFYVDKAGADYDGTWTTTSITVSNKRRVRDYLVCSCPECHKIIKKLRTREEDNCNYYYYSPAITATSETCTAKTNGVSSLDINLSDCTTVHNDEFVTPTTE